MDRFEGIVRSQSYSLIILDDQAALDEFSHLYLKQPEQGQQEHMVLLLGRA